MGEEFEAIGKAELLLAVVISPLASIITFTYLAFIKHKKPESDYIHLIYSIFIILCIILYLIYTWRKSKQGGSNAANK